MGNRKNRGRDWNSNRNATLKFTTGYFHACQDRKCAYIAVRRGTAKCAHIRKINSIQCLIPVTPRVSLCNAIQRTLIYIFLGARSPGTFIPRPLRYSSRRRNNGKSRDLILSRRQLVNRFRVLYCAPATMWGGGGAHNCY